MNKILPLLQAVLLTAGLAFGQTVFTLTEEADTYFIMNLGRYVSEHGCPHVDPFTVHENLHPVAQQWLSGIFFWEAYKALGIDGLRLIDFIFGAATVLIYWRLCLFFSGGNKLLSFGLSFIVGLIVIPAIVPRPQLFSMPLLLVEVFFLEKFTRTKNFKFLLPLLPVSVALINLHAAVWLMSLVLCVPFLFVKDLRQAELLIVVMEAIAAFGLINPYGLEAMTYVFRSYGIDLINNAVPEMFTPTAHDLLGKCFYFTEAFLIFSLTKFKVPWRYILLSGGITFMAIMHARNQGLFYFLATLPVAYAWRNFKPPKFLAGRALNTLMFLLLVSINTALITTIINDNLEKLSLPLEILFFAAMLVVLYNLLVLKCEGRLFHHAILPRKILSLFITALIVAGISFTTLDGSGRDRDGIFAVAMKYLLQSERPENILLYAGQGYGGLAGLFGVRYYLDSRSEVFLPENNGQKNIFAEYLDFKSGKIHYKDFFARYNFTHIFVTTKEDPFIFDLLTNDENFRAIYESEHIENYSVVRCKIFVPRKGE